jgi:spore coat polysaccharide biosynthesis protein SpsF (cytidylyltransferase family)
MTAPRSAVALLDLAATSPATGEPMSALCFRHFGRHSLLEWSLRRLSEAALIDHLAIVGPSSLVSQVKQCNLQNALWFASDSHCALERSEMVAERLFAKWMIYTSPKCPFVDAVLLDRMIGAGWKHPDADYVGYFSPTNPQFSLSSLGLVGEMCHRRALEKLKALGLDGKDSRPVPLRLRESADIFTTRMLPLPKALDREDLRFSLESASDWEHIDELLELSDDEADYQRLAEYSLERIRREDPSSVVGGAASPHWLAKSVSKSNQPEKFA